MSFAFLTSAAFWTGLVKDLVVAAISGTLGAIAGAIVGYSFRSLRQLPRRLRFRRVFGKQVVRSTDIVISVPLWRTIGQDRSVPRFIKEGPNYTEQRLHGPDQMYNRQDMRATAYVLSVLYTQFDDEIGYTNDTESQEWNSKTLILIGSPASNLHARDYLARHREQRPNDRMPLFREIEESAATGARTEIVHPDTGQPLVTDGRTDYGVVWRFPNIHSERSDHFVFLIAGVHEWSTREAGRLFSHNWESFAREPLWRRFRRFVLRERPPATGYIFSMGHGEGGLGTGQFLTAGAAATAPTPPQT